MKITRSYSRKKNIGNYQTLDYFCSVEQEIDDTSEMKSTSKLLQEFCIKEVDGAIEDYEKKQEAPELSEPKEPKETMTLSNNKSTNNYVNSNQGKELNFKNVKLDGN